jgi:hypothetical protein
MIADLFGRNALSGAGGRQADGLLRDRVPDKLLVAADEVRRQALAWLMWRSFRAFARCRGKTPSALRH